MSLNAVERALWEVTQSPDHIARYLADPGKVLGQYALSDEERKNILEKNVKALANEGSSQMLLMLFWLATSGGFATLPEYLGRMNAPAH